MKKRHGGKLAFAVVILVLFGGLAVPSLLQNMKIRGHFTQLFQAIKERDREGVLKFYDTEQIILPEYLDQIMQYNLLGWKITKITGQPWPMEKEAFTDEDLLVFSAELYYELPDNLKKPQGRYEAKNLPFIGPCAVVPVELKFVYQKSSGKFGVTLPKYETGKYWVGPFLKPLKTPPPPPEKPEEVM